MNINQIRILTVLYAGIMLWMSACTTDHNKSTLLSDALRVVDNNPQKTLDLLKGISPEYLRGYDKDQYMQYVVILTQARYMDDQDITGDSLILDAQRYFVRNQNYEMAARAGYYAAVYWHEGEANDKALEYWQATFDNAKKASNDLFMAKSAYSLGMTYFNQEQWEDALPYCQKALELYKNKPDAERYNLYITEMLGQIYRRQQDFELAYLYFDNGLKTAKKLNNTKHEARSLRNIGLIHRDKGEYRQAKEYFNMALSIQPDPEDKLRIYLSYARLYREMNHPDSTIFYLNILKERISDINYSNTLRSIYEELANYHQSNEGNISEIAQYISAHIEDLRIKKNQSEKKADAIHQQLEQIKQKKYLESKTYRRMFDYGLIALCLLASLLVIIWFNKNALKEKYKQIKEKYSDIRNLQFNQTVDQLHFLLAGLRSIAKSTDDLRQKELAYAGSPVWEQQLALFEEFSTQLAGYAKMKLEKQPNGSAALDKLTPEDLSIMQLSRFRFSDEEIGWLLGHKGDTKEPIILRKEQIRRILVEAGMKEKDIKTFFIIESN